MTTPPIDLTSRDWSSLRQSMLDFAAVRMPDWIGAKTGDPNDFGVMLAELLAYEGDILNYYVDRVANEAFLSTATQRSSILAHAALLGYTPHTATASTVEVEFTVTSTVPITIPAGFLVATQPDGDTEPVTFETTAALEIPAGTNVTASVTAVQGVTVADEVIATSCGDIDESYPLTQSPVVADSIVIRVVEDPVSSGQVWVQVANLLDANGDANAYTTQVDENDAVTILFGDGVNGRIPPRGAVIHASYRVGGGAAGDVDAGTIVDVTDPTDYLPPDAVPPPEILVHNQDAALGGTDSESLDSIRTNAPRVFRAGTRAVGLPDFEGIALSVNGVAKAKAVAVVYTNVVVYVAPSSGTQPDVATLARVEDAFVDKVIAGVTVTAATPAYVQVDVTVLIDVDPRFAQYVVQQAVHNALASYLDFSNVDFGQTLSVSDIYTVLRAVEGVDNITLVTFGRVGSTGAADIPLNVNELPLSGTLDVQTVGGITNSDVSIDIIGASTGATPPSPSGIPAISLSRCDPASAHYDLSWTPGANTTRWYVQVRWYDIGDAVVQSQIFGPYTSPAASLDLPFIGAGRTDSLGFTTRAYNGSVGPAISPEFSEHYDCDPGPPGPVAPDIESPSLAVTCLVGGGSYVNVTWTGGATAHVVLYLSSAGPPVVDDKTVEHVGTSPLNITLPAGAQPGTGACTIQALLDTVPILAASTPASHAGNPSAVPTASTGYSCS